jgi:hypothetical protein
MKRTAIYLQGCDFTVLKTGGVLQGVYGAAAAGSKMKGAGK